MLTKRIEEYIIILLLLGQFLTASGQQQDIYLISGSFNNIPFNDFVKEVERKTQLKFYFQEEWVQELKVTFSGYGINIPEILAEQLKRAGLWLYADGLNLYIYSGNQIITELPENISFKTEIQKKDTAQIKTESEQKYLVGKTTTSIGVISIGNMQDKSGNTKCIITGRIIDASNLEPLTGATIFLEELKTGTAADNDGRFKLVLDPGKYKATFSYMSMKQQQLYLQVYSTGFFTVEMKKELISLEEVQVTANRYDNIRGMQMGFEKISMKSMKEIPVLFGEKDVIKVATMLPGVLNVGEGTAGFNVRGSAEDQNMFYINKVPVYNTSHVFGFFTSFNPDIINDFSFYKSNIPASYGGRLSSIFNITTRQGSKRKLYGMGGISPITGHASLELPVIKDKLSVVASFRTSYSDWLLKQVKNKDISQSSANFYDGSFSFNTDINEKNILKGFYFTSRDKFTLSSINDYEYSNHGSSIDWKHIYSSTLSLNVTAVYSSYSFENTSKSNLSTAFTQKYRINHYETRTDFSIINKADHKINFGASAILYDLDRGTITPFGEKSNRMPVDLGKEAGLEGALYISDEFALLKNLNVTAGLRYSMFNQYGPAKVAQYVSEDSRLVDNITEYREYKKGDLIKSYSGPEYRVALNYNLGPVNSVKASYNRLYQYIFMLRNSIAISPDDKWKLCDFHIKPPVADQISVGYYRNFDEGKIKASAELYHKWVNNQVEYKDGTDFTSPDPIETQILQGKQRVSGIELMLNKNTGKTTGWISYCYSRSLIKIDGDNVENKINNGLEYPSDYDRPHSINLVVNYKTNRRLSVSANFVYTTGRPITYPVSVYYSEGQQILSFSKRNEFRIPDYARVDLSFNLEGNLIKKKPIHSSWSLNVYNLLGRNNAYSIYFDSVDGKVFGHKLSIFGIPIFTIAWNYKFGNYLND